MITLSRLTKSYGNTPVYQDFDFSFPQGQITCLLGESGCGKTTLLNVLANLTSYTGEVPRLQVSYVFQTPRLIPHMTVEQNLLLVQKDSQKVGDMLALMGLTDKKNAYPHQLSGGQQQRVSLARAMVFPCDVLLMDEPFSSLDVKSKVSLMSLVKNIVKQNHQTVLFVTHDVDEATFFADRVTLLQRGKVALILSVTEQSDYGVSSLRPVLLNALLQND